MILRLRAHTCWRAVHLQAGGLARGRFCVQGSPAPSEGSAWSL